MATYLLVIDLEGFEKVVAFIWCKKPECWCNPQLQVYNFLEKY